MTSTPPDVIIIRGAPGVGKSLASKCLASHFPKGVRIEVDILRAMVISVDWTNQTEHINILLIATGAVRDFLKLGYKPVIVVDTFSGNKLTQFLNNICAHGNCLDIHAFALVAASEVLNIRVENRPLGQFKEIDICQKLNKAVLKHIHPIEKLIDNSNLTPEETADMILKQCVKD